jgi:hypothetical protein
MNTPSDAYAERGFVLVLEVVAAWPHLIHQSIPSMIRVATPQGDADLECVAIQVPAAGCSVHYYARAGAAVSPRTVIRQWVTAIRSTLRVPLAVELESDGDPE